jgi:hypothetical protein
MTATHDNARPRSGFPLIRVGTKRIGRGFHLTAMGVDHGRTSENGAQITDPPDVSDESGQKQSFRKIRDNEKVEPLVSA